MDKHYRNDKREMLVQYAPLVGVVLVISGLLLLLDQRLKSNWISISIPALIGLVFVSFGFYRKSTWWVLPGFAIIGLSLALVLLVSPAINLDLKIRLGYSFLANALVWFLIFLVMLILSRRKTWWALFISFILAALTIIFLSGRFSLLVFIFYISGAVGLVFLLWGSFSGRMAFIIPGALLIATGAGVFYGWSNPETPGGLQKTGIMLVWFALGWGLITVFSRFMHKRFIWWPLIPGGILLMVGSGLYIGGNPENALGFLGNTGSIGLILVGAYLIFLKFGMKR